MARSKQLRESLMLGTHEVLLEGDPLVAAQHRARAADGSRSSPDALGNVDDLEAPRLPLRHPAPEPLEGVLEPRPDVVGLEAPGLSLGKVPADALDVAGIEHVGGKAVLGDQLGQALP